MGSLTARIKVEGLLATFEQIVLSDEPVERFKELTKALEKNVVVLNRSSKHMIDRNLGNLEASPSLKYRRVA